MRILVLGGNGQVGFELLRSLKPLGKLTATTRSGFLPDGTGCETLALDDLIAIVPLLERVKPTVVVNATAATAVDRAEDEREASFLVNSLAPEAIAHWCKANAATLVHYSTDYVFDGSGSRPYTEHDPVAPLGVYGASKLAGELAIQASGAKHLILRTAWVYGFHGSNFLRTMLRVGAEREELRVVNDQHGTPTPAWLLADVTAAVLARGLQNPGVRHLVAAGRTTWHGFSEAIFDEAVARGLLERAPRVVPITTVDYPTRARRPAWSVLDTSCLRVEYAVQLPHWRAALAQTFERGDG